MAQHGRVCADHNGRRSPAENNYSNLQQCIQLLISKLFDESDIYIMNKNYVI
jgi:hypothetical protein